MRNRAKKTVPKFRDCFLVIILLVFAGGYSQVQREPYFPFHS